MKKVALMGLAVVALMAMALAYTVVAGEHGSCTAEQKAACAAKGDKASLTSSTTGTATKACTEMSKADCAKLCGISEAECAALCKELGADTKWEMRHISVTGMTCGGCESSVTTALTKTPGVLKVIKVDHKTGIALVAIDPTKSQDAVLASAVVNSGFKAEIIPAVATTTGAKTVGKAGCASKDGASATSTGKTCTTTSETKTETGSASTPH
jgi:copper chaperone